MGELLVNGYLMFRHPSVYQLYKIFKFFNETPETIQLNFLLSTTGWVRKTRLKNLTQNQKTSILVMHMHHWGRGHHQVSLHNGFPFFSSLFWHLLKNQHVCIVSTDVGQII